MAAGLQAVHDHVHTLLHLLLVWVTILVDVRLGHAMRAEEYLRHACTVRDWAEMRQLQGCSTVSRLQNYAKTELIWQQVTAF